MSEIREDLDRVAIVGMAGRFPGAPDVDAFWENLTQGREGIGFFSDDELRASGVSEETLRQESFVKAKGELEDADRFDASFFGYSPREAEIMDPQHRVFLELAWEALENAGCVPQDFDGRIGVFAGAGLNSYLLHNVMANQKVFDAAGMYQTLLASDKDFLSTRVAYKLGLKGPALTVQTACSTSLTAVHLAVQSLLNGECDIALAGGVAVSSPLKNGHTYETGGILSPDGHCRPFDAEAGGTVAGNGAGLVVLRRLEDARSGGDRIDAVIRGSAVNNDGSLKAGYTAPSVEGQAEVITEALAVADVDPATVGYVETHGTGTRLGDPIEIAALTRAYREQTDASGYCAIGSVKSNIGHLDAAAGVTSLIKAVLVLRHQAIPPTLHFASPNPELGLESSPFYVNDELRPWPRQEGQPRLAAVSSFGIGGTNVHVVLEEAPDEAPGKASGGAHDGADRPVVLPLSAKTGQAVADGAERLAGYLEQHPDVSLADVSHTLAHRRHAFGHRTAVAALDRAGAVAALRGVRAADTVAARENGANVAFLFPGQGAQYVNMARDLYAHEPVFARELDHCAELFTPHLGEDLRTLLFADLDEAGAAEAAAAKLEQTRITQPVLFLVEYALAQLWLSWGVRPRAMAGHSIGEYVAACLAGVFSLEDAVRLVAARGRLVQEMPRGSMLTVFLPESEAAAYLGGEVTLAAVNSSALTVVSGLSEAIDALERRLKDEGVSCRRLHTSHAFHSPSMDGAVGPLVEEVRTVALSAPSIPFLSNVTGTWITDEQATDPEYWGRHLRQPVRFADSVAELAADPSLVALEVGPGHTLGNFVRQHTAWGQERVAVGSLRHPNDRQDDRVHLLRSLGALWSAGVPVDFAVLDDEDGRRVLDLPAYAFQRQRYWVEPDADARPDAASRALAQAPVDDWFYTPGWKRLPPLGAPGTAAADGTLWVVLGDGPGLGDALARRLEDGGGEVVRVGAAETFTVRGDGSYALDPADREHLADLVKSLDSRAPSALRFVHLFSLAGEPSASPDGALDSVRLDESRRLGFDSLLALAQALDDVRPSAAAGIDVLCEGVRSVTGEERLRPENATLTGAATVIPQELSDTAVRTLDITGADPAAPREQTVRAVHTAVTHATADRDLALRGAHWWARGFDAVPLGPDTGAAPARLRDGGVYLITGGLGGVGLALAEDIAGGVQAPVLALLSRSPFPAEQEWDAHLAGDGGQDATAARIHRLRALKDLGAQVTVLTGDVTDAEQMAAHVARLRKDHGGLHGVIHAAGLPSSGMIARKTRQDVDGVLAAKTRGTLVLDRVCGDELDFFLLCSSVTAVLGGPGQSDYAAANAFLDAFAEWKSRRGATQVTAVNWGTWNGVGMAADGLVAQIGGGEGAGEPTGHPLLRLLETGAGTRTYSATFSTADSWVVSDHRLMGHGLVPGTAYLDLVHAALAEQAAGRAVQLHDVLFMQPVIVPDEQRRTVFLTVEEDGDQLRFTVRSRAEGGASWRDHAVGTATFAERGADTVRDLDEVLARCEVTEVLDGAEEIKKRLRVDAFEKGRGPLEFWFGPRWQLLESVHTGGRRMLATLALDEEFRADTEEFPLHPALLDMAGGVFRIHAKHLYYLPLTYRALKVHHPLTPTVLCAVEMKDSGEGETMSCDIELLSPEGLLLVEITDFTIKRINDVDALLEQIRHVVAEAESAGEQGGADEEEGGVLRTLSEGMSEREGRQAFARILSAPVLPHQLVVSAKDFGALRELAATITPELLAREVEQLAPVAAAHPRPDLDTPYVAPATEAELGVAAVWREVLGVEEVGVNDDFFALGGHSLAAVQIGTRVHSRFGVELDLRDFFNDPTVAHTVTLLSAGAGQGGEADVIQALRREETEDVDDSLEELDLANLSDEEIEARLQQLLAEES
ncbi:SDR family NAD(P)-dependent oxidoreductase [Streptomyces sp. NPDC002446]